MKIRIKYKENKIWIKSSLCIVLGVGVIGGIYYNLRHKKPNELMKEIAKPFFYEHINEIMSQFKKDEVNWSVGINQLKIISGDVNEFIVKIKYDLNIIDEVECEYFSQQWMMKIKCESNGEYKLVEQGEDISSY